MSSFSWLRSYPRRLFGGCSRPVSPSRKRVSPQRRVRPCLEALEDRAVPAIFNVGAGDVAGLIADIKAANSDGDPSNVINLTNSAYKLTAIDNNWYGPNGLPPITSNLTIHGNGATIERPVLSGAPGFRFFYVSGGMELPAGSLTMDNVTLEQGRAQGGSSAQGGGGLGAGGAIFNQGTLNLTGVSFTLNEATGGNSNGGSGTGGGGGMGQDASSNGDGGGFGASVGSFGGTGASGNTFGGGGGGGFLTGANGTSFTDTSHGRGGGLGGFAVDGTDGGYGGAAADLLPISASGSGGSFGSGGTSPPASSNGGTVHAAGGGGGVGGGGGAGGNQGGNGGFGGGGGYGANSLAGAGGFGGGGGGTGDGAAAVGLGGFGGGNGSTTSGGAGAGMGGAIFNMGAYPGGGQATIVNCTFFLNSAVGGTAADPSSDGSGFGGAIFNLDGKLTLTNDTLDANHATSTSGGGAVYNLAYGNDISTGGTVAASLVLNNSILANSATTLGGASTADLVSKVVNGAGSNTATVSGGHNLVMSSSGTIGNGVIALNTDPLFSNSLGALQNNGGLTPTLLPQSGSPAFGAGDPSLAPSTDQRGQSRPTNGPSDLGSVQVSLAATTTSVTSNPTVPFSASNQNVTLTATVSSSGGVVNEGTVTFTVKQGAKVIGTATTSGTVSNGQASVQYVLPGGAASGTYTITASYSDSPEGSFAASSDSGSLIVAAATGGGSTGSGGSTSNSTPPTLHKPPLLAFIDSILGGIETINNNHTETVTDSIFGFPLIVSTYDGAGNLTLVTYFGINITFLFA